MRIKDLEQSNIVIFGENHTKPDEVDFIREQIVEMEPEVIVHELHWEDKEYYSKHLPSTKVIPLEDEYEGNHDLKTQFKIREQSMIEHLNEVVEDFKSIAVVIGDTHLRSIETEELGGPSPILEWAREHNALVIRSQYPEIE